MNWPYIHLVINHFPVILAVVGAIAALLGAVTGKRSVWLYAVVTLVLAGVTAVATYISGDQAGDVMRYQTYVVRDMLREHDQAATFALWGGIIIGLAGIAGWWQLTRTPSQSIAKWLRITLVLLGLWYMSVVSRVAYLGGKIVYESPALGGHGVGLHMTPPTGADH